jgi:hypothetical protein
MLSDLLRIDLVAVLDLGCAGLDEPLLLENEI